MVCQQTVEAALSRQLVASAKISYARAAITRNLYLKRRAFRDFVISGGKTQTVAGNSVHSFERNGFHFRNQRIHFVPIVTEVWTVGQAVVVFFFTMFLVKGQEITYKRQHRQAQQQQT